MVAAILKKSEPSVVTLRSLEASDRLRIQTWMADDAVVRFTVLVPSPDCAPAVPYGVEAADRYLHTLLTDPTRRAYAVLEDGVHVGNVGLKDVVPGCRDAECFVEIGAPAARGRGVARRAMAMLLDEAFFILGLEEISLGVFEFNDNAVRLYARLGFRRIGHYGWHWVDGRYHEVWKMQLRRSDWAAQPILDDDSSRRASSRR